ncbi:AAA family ATPase [Corynebacterium hadale]|uniref:AAA family ATPase n=1 Tax=Corynebacterium hadale TaxID=2026255 RepID=UPI0013FDEEF9|nr:AAA family ATPase [Corynebacterium hadale]
MTNEQQLAQLEEQLGAIHLKDIQPRTEQDVWLIPGVVHATNTLLYGTSSAGKSLAVAHIIASLLDGREFLGVKPLVTGLNVLVVCSDRGAEHEYRDRLGTIGVDVQTAGVTFLTGVGTEPQQWWNSVHEYARRAGVDLVVVDHASGVLDGDELEKAPWRELWTQRLAPFNLPVILVAHSSDYTGPRGPSHRVMGNSAASQFARAEVEIYRTNPNAYADSMRVLRSKSRDGTGIQRRFWISDNGVIVRDEQAEQQAGEKARQRSKQTMDSNHRIAQLACQSSGKNKTEVARDIASEVRLSVNNVRAKKLNDLEHAGMLCQRTNNAGGMYSPGPKLELAGV